MEEQVGESLFVGKRKPKKLKGNQLRRMPPKGRVRKDRERDEVVTPEPPGDWREDWKTPDIG